MPTDPVQRYLETRRRRDFAALVRATRGEVLDAAYRVLGDRTRAEDVAQDVYLQLLKTRQGAGEVRSGRGLLVAMAVSRARDAARAERRRANRERTVEERAAEERGGGPRGDSSAERSEEVRSAVEALPDELRRCVELRYFGGLPVAEVARALGWAPRTTSQRLSQARERLAARLAATGFAPLLAVLEGDGGADALPHLPPSAEWSASLERIARDGVPLAHVATGRGLAAPAALVGGAAAVVLAAAAVLAWSARGGEHPEALETAQPVATPTATVPGVAGSESGPGESRAALAGAAAEGASGAAGALVPRVEIEVLTPAGRPARWGTAEIALALDHGLDDLEALEPWAHHLGEHDLAAANPLVFADLPVAAAGLALEVAVRDTGYPPVGGLPLVVRGDAVTHLRVDLPPPAGLAVLVVDHGTGAPVEDALVFDREAFELGGFDSAEVARRGAEALEGDSRPGWSLTDGGGVTTLSDLGAFPREVVCIVPGRARVEAVARDAAAPLCIALPSPQPRAALAVRVLGPGGELLAGVGVELSPRGRHAGVTGADGVARLAAVPAGDSVHVALEASSFAELLHARGWRWSSSIAASRAVTLAPGEERELTLGFLPAAADVLLEVVDPRGTPVADEDVELSGPVQLEATTGADGVARFEDVPEGEYTPGFAGFFEAWSSAQDVAVGPGSPVRARLVRGEALLLGSVVSGRDGTTPLACTVIALGPSTAMTRTDAEGRFALESVAPGRYRLSTSTAGDCAGAELELEVAAGESEVSVRLVAPPGEQMLVVLGPELSGARPTLRGADGSEPLLAPAEAEPFLWRSPLLSSGAYTLRVELPDGRVLERELEVLPGVPTRFEIP